MLSVPTRAQVFAEQVVDYTGTDIIDPPLVYPMSADLIHEFESWSQIAEDCSNSRLWGGMHFYVSETSFRGGPSGFAAGHGLRVEHDILLVSCGVLQRRCPLSNVIRSVCSLPSQDAVPAGEDLCGGGLMAPSITASLKRLIAGDEAAAVFKYDPGEIKVRPH